MFAAVLVLLALCSAAGGRRAAAAASQTHAPSAAHTGGSPQGAPHAASSPHSGNHSSNTSTTGGQNTSADARQDNGTDVHHGTSGTHDEHSGTHGTSTPPLAQVMEACERCVDKRCPLEEFGPGQLTWFDESCSLHHDAETRYCLNSLSPIYTAHQFHGAEGHSTIHDSHSAIPWNILTIFLSFAVGAIVRFVLQGTPVPYTVALFLLGMGFGFVSKVEVLNLGKFAAISEMDPHLIFYVFLPVLIFESAFAMDIPTFSKVIGQCLIMAVPGLMVAAGLTGAVAKFTFAEYDWNWYVCLLFGTVLSATDPVAVVALLKDLGASPVISTMIEGESLFNDGTAIVFFNVLVGAIRKESCEPVWEVPGVNETYCWGTTADVGCLCKEVTCTLDMSILSIFAEFCRVSFGGALMGLAVGVVTVFSLNRVFNDALIEITMTLVAAYVAFFLCEGMAHVSGVLGVVACGCYMSYFNTCISPDVLHTLHHFWEMTVYLTNTMVFILAGMICALKAFETVTLYDLGYLGITYVAINIVRIIVIALFTPVLRLFKYKLDLGNAALVAWGGLRGAVGLALALLVQADEEIAVSFVRNKLIFHVACICILTLCVNGVTTQYLVAYFQLSAVPQRRRKAMSQRWAVLLAEQRETITDLRGEPLYYDTNWEWVDAFVSLQLTIPRELEDPYNERGWAESASLVDAEAKQQQNAEEGKIAYLNTCAASVHAQYAFGTLTREGVRELMHMIVACREDPSPVAYIPSEVQESLFKPSLASRVIGVVSREAALRAQWTLGTDVALGFIACHDLACQRIRSLAELRVSNAVETHCKRATTQTVTRLADVAGQRPDISCSIKTRQAARHVLNAMRREVATMKREGHVDSQDAAALLAIIRARAKSTSRMPDVLQYPSALQALQATEWYQKAEPEARAALAQFAERDTLPPFPPQTCLAPRGKDPGGSSRQVNVLPGLCLVVTGIVQLRVGRRMFRYGSGHVLGWQQLLTNSTRFSDAWTNTECRLHFVDPGLVLPLIAQHPNLRGAAWQACGESAATVLMSVDDTGRFDPKNWSERRIRKTARKGVVDILQDPDAFAATHERKHKLAEGAITVLLRGRAWEYGEENDHLGTAQLCRFPTLIPGSFKFATFTGHSVLMTIHEEATAATRARRRWGRLRNKVRSIFIWTNLRGREWGRVALARAFNVLDPDEDPRSPWFGQECAPREALDTSVTAGSMANSQLRARSILERSLGPLRPRPGGELLAAAGPQQQQRPQSEVLQPRRPQPTVRLQPPAAVGAARPSSAAVSPPPTPPTPPVGPVGPGVRGLRPDGALPTAAPAQNGGPSAAGRAPAERPTFAAAPLQVAPLHPATVEGGDAVARSASAAFSAPSRGPRSPPQGTPAYSEAHYPTEAGVRRPLAPQHAASPSTPWGNGASVHSADPALPPVQPPLPVASPVPAGAREPRAGDRQSTDDYARILADLGATRTTKARLGDEMSLTTTPYDASMYAAQ